DVRLPQQPAEVTPCVRATKHSPLVQQALTTHSVIESDGRIASLSEEYERVDSTLQETARRFSHHAPPDAQPLVLPAQIDLRQLSREIPLVGPTQNEPDHVSALALDDNEEFPRILPAEQLRPLPGAHLRGGTPGAIGRIPELDVERGQFRNVCFVRVPQHDALDFLAARP